MKELGEKEDRTLFLFSFDPFPTERAEGAKLHSKLRLLPNPATTPLTPSSSSCPYSDLNILINNAGANWGAPLSTYPDSAFTKVLTLNLQRVFTLSQRLVPLLSLGSNMGSNDPARIINIGSVDGVRVPRLETYAYSASKAALHQLSRVLASHLGPEGITSNVLACGSSFLPFLSFFLSSLFFLFFSY